MRPNNQQTTNNMSFEDSENFQEMGALGIKEISLELFRRCAAEGSKEMYSGGIQTRIINGQPIEMILPNQIEIFINSVRMFRTVLEPKIRNLAENNPEATFVADKINNFDNKLNELYKWKKAADNKINLEIPMEVSTTAKQMNIRNWELRRLNDTFEQKRIALYRELFTALSFLLDVFNYFSETGSVGG